MKIKRLELQNFRSASKIAFDFTSQLNLFVGVNGSGKSTVLDALSTCLSWLVKRIEQENGRGSDIPVLSLRNNQVQAYLDIHVTEKNISYHWLLTKTKERASDPGSQLGSLNKLTQAIKTHEQDISLPVITYYPVNRTVEAVRPEIPNRDSIYGLDVYENALEGKANYQSFFEWFRLQDDILNEKSMSRTRWMRQNRKWIEVRINYLFEFLKDFILDDQQHFDFDEIKYRFEKDEIYLEPRSLLYELSHLIGRLSHKHSESEKILHDLEFMFLKMSSLSSEFRDDLIAEGGVHEEIVERIIRNFDFIWSEKKPDKKFTEFLWELFSFATLLSLWWLSDKGRRDLDQEFKTLKNLPDLGGKKTDSMVAKLSSALRQIIKQEVQQKKDYRNEGQELHTVNKAIEQFVPEYSHLRVKRVPRPHMLIDKKGESFNLDQLSDGEKNLIAMVGDIARRLAIGNPKTKNPLKGEGIILIDEIDLHLHPCWQRLVIPKLLEVFPNCQFFISTHSPQVISHVKPDSIFLLEQTEEGLNYRKTGETYGMSLDRVVELVMDDESRPNSVRDDLDKLFELVERKKLTEAKELVSSLKKDMQTDPELMRAEMLIRREEIKR